MTKPKPKRKAREPHVWVVEWKRPTVDYQALSGSVYDTRREAVAHVKWRRASATRSGALMWRYRAVRYVRASK